MYELKLTKQNKQKFVDVARHRLSDRQMTIKTLAEKIGRPVNSVYGFFNSYQKKPNRFLAAEIADALNIQSKDWRD